jgi:hypothetical protein
MDFLPRLQSLLPGETGGVPNQMPQDDTMMQFELKRKLALSDALRNQSMPEGQMVSGHYVAPSWTQYLSNAVNKYQGGQAEKDAMKQYGDYKTAENARMSEALGKFGKAFEPTTTTNTTYAPGVGKELAMGDTVQTAPNFGATPNLTEQVAPTSPYGTQNMTGNAVTSVPTTTTSTVQPTDASMRQAFNQYAIDTRQPKLAEQLMMGDYEAQRKRNAPYELAAGATRYEGGTNKVIATNPKDISSLEQSMFSKINPSEYTPESVRKFMQSKDYGDLQFNAASRQAGQTPYFQALPTAQGYAKFNARTGQIDQLPLQGQAVLPAAQSPQLQGEISGSRFLGEAEAKRGFNMAGAPDIVNDARNILTGKVKPTSSGLGTIADVAGSTVGYAPIGAAQADQLRAIGGQLVAKMPRMEGPQSDRDVALYTQMAGQIGDSTIPVSRRIEALKTVEGIVSKYATKQPMGNSTQDQQALQWANSNPNDPRSKAIKQKLGVK